MWWKEPARCAVSRCQRSGCGGRPGSAKCMTDSWCVGSDRGLGCDACTARRCHWPQAPGKNAGRERQVAFGERGAHDPNGVTRRWVQSNGPVKHRPASRAIGVCECCDRRQGVRVVKWMKNRGIDAIRAERIRLRHARRPNGVARPQPPATGKVLPPECRSHPQRHTIFQAIVMSSGCRWALSTAAVTADHSGNAGNGAWMTAR